MDKMNQDQHQDGDCIWNKIRYNKIKKRSTNKDFNSVSNIVFLYDSK